MTKFCINCGAQLPDAAKFCNKCGAKQQQQQQPPPPRQQQQQSPPQQQQPQYQQPQQRSQQPLYDLDKTTVSPRLPPKAQPMAAAPPPQAGRKKRRVPLAVKIICVIILVIALAAVAVTAVISLAMSGAGKMDYYKFGNDQIPSVKLALGEERKLVGASTSSSSGGASSSGGVSSKVFQYRVSGTAQNADIEKYTDYLRAKNSFILLAGSDLSGAEGSCKLERNSSDSGYMLRMEITYDADGYTVTILKQKGAVTETQSDDETADGTTDTNEGADNAAPGDKGDLTRGILDTVSGGTYHMKIRGVADDMTEMEVDFYLKDGMAAVVTGYEGTNVRVVIKDEKRYTILDEQKMIVVGDASSDDTSIDVGDASNLIYIGEGSGEFKGKMYRYDEYEGEEDARYYYYVDDGGGLKGIRTVTDGDATDVEIVVFERDFPDDVFVIPSDYSSIYEDEIEGFMSGSADGAADIGGHYDL